MNILNLKLNFKRYMRVALVCILVLIPMLALPFVFWPMTAPVFAILASVGVQAIWWVVLGIIIFWIEERSKRKMRGRLHVE